MSSALLSAISWILRGGAGNDMDSTDLNSELLQLGTPRSECASLAYPSSPSFREHAGAITRVYKEKSQKIMDALKKRSLRLSSLETFEGKVSDAAGKNEKLASITVGTKSGVNNER